jgi:hypothetical protein
MINQVEKAIRLARKHAHEGEMNSSVRLCLAEAVNAMDTEQYEAAHRWAVKSLSYSVGIAHPDYKKAAA